MSSSINTGGQETRTSFVQALDSPLLTVSAKAYTVNGGLYHYGGPRPATASRHNPVRHVDPDGRSDCGIFDGEGNYTDKLVRDRIERVTGQNLDDIISNFNNGREESLHIDKDTLRTLFFDADRAKELLMERENLHKDLRYQLNSNAPSEEQKVKDINMIKLPWWKSIFHNPFKNNKYVSADGHLEGVYDKKRGLSDDTPETMATFNFFDPNKQATGHKKADVDPYVKWGN